MRPFARAVVVLVMAQASQGASYEEAGFTNKTLTLLVGAPPRGVLDLFARPIAEHMPTHLPGHPKIVLSYAPGAASKIAARHLYNQAPRDGTWFGAVFPSIDALFEGAASRGYDPLRFEFLGSAQTEVNVCIICRDVTVRSLADLTSKELTIAVTAPGSTNFDFPQFLNGLGLTHFKLVRGYPGGQALKLALESDELKGACGSWAAAKVYYPGILDGKTDFQVIARGDRATTRSYVRPECLQSAT